MKKLLKMQYKAALLVLRDPVFLPIFERLEREVEMAKKREKAIERARAVVDSYRGEIGS